MKTRLIAALMLGVATATLGPVGCKMHDNAAEMPAQGTGVGIDLKAMDKAARPGDDFYAYANGGWMAATQIPADRPSIGAFWIADQKTEGQIANILADLGKSEPEAGSNAALVKNYYDAYLDTATIDRLGMQPVQADLNRIAGIADKTQ
ncbi:MAG: hypothetical protein RLZZ08_2058, partial [Pseudomonadota bacterium]